MKETIYSQNVLALKCSRFHLCCRWRSTSDSSGSLFLFLLTQAPTIVAAPIGMMTVDRDTAARGVSRWAIMTPAAVCCTSTATACWRRIARVAIRILANLSVVSSSVFAYKWCLFGLLKVRPFRLTANLHIGVRLVTDCMHAQYAAFTLVFAGLFRTHADYFAVFFFSAECEFRVTDHSIPLCGPIMLKNSFPHVVLHSFHAAKQDHRILAPSDDIALMCR
jgi:hypothetical protein